MPAQRDRLEACVTISYEEFLAGETGTLLLLVDGFYFGGADSLDWSSQLHRTKQSAENAQGRSSSFLP